MADPQSDEIHPIWGRSIREYTRSYSWTSVEADFQVPADETNRATRREVALRTIEQISMIDYSGISNPLSSEIVNRVTLEKFECVLELTRFPGELDNFVVPSLVAGCITLMSSIKPSPFCYEYGYLCFRILVIALNTCLLKHGRNPNEALRIPNLFGPNYLADLWSETAVLLRAELGGISEMFFEMPDMRSGPRAAPHLEAMRLDILLTLLHSDQKNFTILLMEANSLGLSGLMYVLWKFVEKNKAGMIEEQYQERLLIPFTRIFYRYRLSALSVPFELDALRWIYHPGPLAGNRSGKPMNSDLEDSRNIMLAYCRSMSTHELEPTPLPDCADLMEFISMFVAPGCEDLVGWVIKASIQVVWYWITGPRGPEDLMDALTMLVQYYCIIIRKTNILRADVKPWVDRLLHGVFHTDLLGLILRITLAIPTLFRDHPQSRLRHLIDAYVNLLMHVPINHFKARLRDTSTLWLWRKYLIYFGSSSLFSPSHPNVKHQECTVIIIEICQKLLPKEWAIRIEAVQPLGICGNPRCPLLFCAEFSCPKDHAPYCNTRCQGLGRVYASPNKTETSMGIVIPQVKAPRLANPLVYVVNNTWPEHAGPWEFH